MAEEFYDFETALKRLGLEAEELKRLVSEGEIRAFRDGDRMRLRAEDVEGLRRGIEEGAFLEEDAEDVTEELVFEEDTAADEEVGMATAQISEDDTLLQDEDTFAEEELEIPEAAETTAAPVARRRTRHEKLKAEGETQESPLFTGVSLVACLLALVGVACAVFGSSGREGITGFWTGNLGKTFAGSDIELERLPTSIGPEARR